MQDQGVTLLHVCASVVNSYRMDSCMAGYF